MTDTKLAAEIVKLKQEMVELRAAIDRIDAELIWRRDLLKDHDGNCCPTLTPLDDGWGHAEDGWPWDTSATPDAFLTARTDWQT